MSNQPENETNNFLQDIPVANSFSTIMNEPNEKIDIYEGDFVIKRNDIEINCKGNFKYEWYPSSGPNLFGQAFNVSHSQLGVLRLNDAIDIYVEGLKIGKVYITRINFSDNPTFKGTMAHECILGDQTIAVDTLYFSVPNLKEFIGDPIRLENTNKVSNGRIRLETTRYIINIDQHFDHSKRRELLQAEGGYLLTYAGEITPKKGSMSHAESIEILKCVSFYLSFINGHQVSAIFLVGSFEGKTVWKDFSNFITHQYLPITSWSDAHSFRDFNTLWESFYKLWCTQSGNDFLRKAIHWYIEANYSPVFAESKIMIAQAGLELVFNWLIIERQNLLVFKTNESISAANKIRLILHQINVDFSIPPGLTHVSAEKNYKTGPETFVSIRNAIVHQQEEKRRKVNELPIMLIYEVFKLGVWYLELAILFILDYHGNYCTRTSISPHRQIVPWDEKKQQI
jgi:hypothetical protein